MNAELLFAKLLAMHLFDTYGIDISAKEILSRKKDYILDNESYQAIMDSMEWLKKVEKCLTIYDKACNAKTLYSTLMKELELSGTFKETDKRKIYTPDNPNLIHLVVIDHLSLVRPSEKRTLKEEMDLISAYLVTLRNMCKISPIVIMQANRDSGGMERRKAGLTNMRLNDTRDSSGPVQDSEIVISIFSPHRERLATYNHYDITKLTDRFRSVTVLKNRYGESDIEIGFNFFGRSGVWAELPLAHDIYDYDKYTNPNYLLESTEDINLDKTNKQSINFTL